MKVKAKWAVKVSGQWRKPGEIFDVDSIAGLKGSVEVIPEEKKPEKAPADEVPAAMPETESAERKAAEKPKPRTATRTRKKTTGK